LLFKNTSFVEIEQDYLEAMKLKLQSGLYSSLNYESSLAELDFLKNEEYYEQNENEFLDENQSNLLTLLLKTESSENLLNSLMNLFDSKIRIEELFIFKINDNTYFNYFVDLLKFKYDVSNMVI
jgi:hypothetical protein